MIRALAIAAAVACSYASFAQADPVNDYPSQPVRIVVGFPAGSSGDQAARTVALALSKSMGRQFVVENRPGASSSTAAIYSARADNDGYTLYQTTVANVVNKILNPGLSFDLLRDFQPVAITASSPVLLVAHPSLGVSTIGELVALAKKKPGEYNYASTGVSTTLHLAGALLNARAGIDLVHVPYQGSPQAVADLLAGRTHVMFAPAAAVLPLIKSGQLIALATASAKRTALMPELPSVSEAGLPELDSSIWFGMMTPKGTPAGIVAKLADAINKAVADPEVIEQLKRQGFDARGSSAEAFAAFLAAETEKWTAAARAAGVLKQ